MTLNIFSCAAFLLIGLSGQLNTVIVETKNGFLRGFSLRTLEGRFVNAFLGVPFAKPPVRELRLRDPVPVDDWKGIKEAIHFGPECCQFTLLERSSSHATGKEDCLYLNIYTPTLNSSELEVIFYIHGGGFTFGSGQTIAPDYLMARKDIVFVSINYRLGPLGFLSSEDDVIPGNFGLKDQVLALRWVNENIERFGGDRNKITVAGFSAGGASVHYLYFSPLSEGLFQRGISQSGTALCPWALTEKSREKAETLSRYLECPTNNMKQTLRCLQSKPAEQIISHFKQFMPWHNNPFTPFGPVIENNTSKHSFLSAHPWQLLRDGRVLDAPWLVSIATEEGLCPAAMFITNETSLTDLEANWNTIAPHLLDYNHTIALEYLNHTSQQIRSFYLGDDSLEIDKTKLIQMLSDRLYVNHIEKSVKLQASVTESPVYLYVFAYQGRYQFSHCLCNCTDSFGVSHGDDMLYLLKTVFTPSPLDSPDDRSMIDTMVNVWSNFIRNGKPGEDLNWIPNSRLDESGNVSFTLITSSTDLKSKSVYSLGNFIFWDQLPFNELENTVMLTQTRRKDEL